MRVLSSAILSVFLSFSAGITLAQNQSVKNYSTQEGLPSEEVFHILQDRSGFLWFSTSNGISVFDGYEMKSYSVHDGIPDPLVLETREDHAGRIWLRSYSGRIAYYEDGIIHPFIHNDSLSQFCSRGFLEAFAQDSAGQWVFYENNDRSGVFDGQGSMNWSMLPRERIAITDHGGHLIIQNSIHQEEGSGTVFIDGKQFPISIPYQDAKYTHHHQSVIRWKGNVYFTVKNNLFRYDGKTVKRVFVAGSAIINLSTDRSDHLYIGHMDFGAVRFTSEDFMHPDTLAFTRHHSVTDVLEDHEGGLWVSTIEAGVFYEPSTGIAHYNLPGNPRIRTALVHNGTILIGTYDGMLLALDEKTKAVKGQQKFERTLMSLYAHRDTIFAGTSTYLYILKDLKQPPVYQYKGSIQGFADRGHDVLALTGRMLVGYRHDGVQVSSKRHPEKIRYAHVTDSLSYVVPHLGLIISDNNLTAVARPKELEHLKISQFMPVNDTTFVLGTIGSGLMVADKSFAHIVKYESLPRDIYSIVKLGKDYYFASEQGIFSIRDSDLLSGTYRTVMLNKGNGLLNEPITLLSAGSDGKLVVFYDRAFSIVDPRTIKNLNYSPRFYLRQILVNNQKLGLRTHYQLPYDSNTLQLDFGFISFNNQDIHIRYRLHQEDSWIYPRRTSSINLYALAPGEYTPELEYSADRFTWQAARTLPAFTIAYPWWRNPYVLILAFIVTCGIVALIVLNRLSFQRERNERLRLLTIQQQQLMDTEKQTTERERNRIAKDLHDSVGSTLLATKLSIGRILRKYDHQEADEIDHQLSHTLNEIKSIIYDLTPSELERDGLSASVRNYIDKLSGVTDIRLNVAFYGDEIHDPRISVPVFRILQELLSNSIKHSNGNSIAVHLNSFDTLLNIVFEDNGRGFTSLHSFNPGLGLASIQSRVQRLNGTMKFDSGDYGTSFIFDIPKAVPQTTA